MAWYIRKGLAALIDLALSYLPFVHKYVVLFEISFIAQYVLAEFWISPRRIKQILLKEQKFL